MRGIRKLAKWGPTEFGAKLLLTDKPLDTARDQLRMLMLKRHGDAETRSDDDPNLAGAWTLPGGHLDPGDDDMAALRRELKEELGLRLRKGRTFARIGQTTIPAREAFPQAYVNTYYAGSLADFANRPKNMEPHKFQSLDWVGLDDYFAEQNKANRLRPVDNAVEMFDRHVKKRPTRK